VPNIVFAIAGALLLARRARSADQPIRIAIPMWRRSAKPDAEGAPDASPAAEPSPESRRAERVLLVVRVPHVNIPRPALLDLYITREYLRTFALAVVSLLGIFYISTFMDVADKLFRGSATSSMLAEYLYFLTPQYIYYIIPMSALVATLVTVGVMTKNSELIVMRACGISLYRAAAPILLFALAASSVLFLLQERVVAYSNQDADRLNRIIRGYPPASFGALDRRWMIGQHGDLYHYTYFDANQNQFSQLTIFHLDDRNWGVTGITRATKAQLARTEGVNNEATYLWKATDGWTRRFTAPPRNARTQQTRITYTPFKEQTLTLEGPAYFKSDEPNPDTMTYGELKEYVARLQEGGYNAVPFMVSLQTKLAFPLVTVVMALLAVPFAVTTGRRGALYGIGAGIVIAIVYRLIVVVFAAVGAAALLPPWIAAWAPNLLFAAAAGYLLLTVRT
jgi:LPS export ABC transporter permease LptG